MLILASTSQTRAKILNDHGIEFEQLDGGFDEESITAKEPKEFVYAAAVGKWEAAKKKFGTAKELLTADTVVAVGSTILRKAKSVEEAERILRLQSGSNVCIYTCTIYSDDRLKLIDLSVTTYEFSTFGEDALTEYLSSGEWEGKAGGCMVEGFCKQYIKSVTGLESCAMGLTIERVKPFLNRKTRN